MNGLILVGDKSSKTNVSKYVAFIGSKCYTTLVKWLKKLDNPYVYAMINSNEDWQIEYIKKHANYKFIALGNKASQRLNNLNIKHFKMSHPSGLNRKLNDKKFVDNMLKECYSFINKGDLNDKQK